MSSYSVLCIEESVDVGLEVGRDKKEVDRQVVGKVDKDKDKLKGSSKSHLPTNC